MKVIISDTNILKPLLNYIVSKFLRKSFINNIIKQNIL